MFMFADHQQLPQFPSSMPPWQRPPSNIIELAISTYIAIKFCFIQL